MVGGVLGGQGRVVGRDSLPNNDYWESRAIEVRLDLAKGWPKESVFKAL